jgi:hypothetical protein
MGVRGQRKRKREGGKAGVSWAQGAEDPVASASVSPVTSLRTGKRRRDTLTQIYRQRRSTRRKEDKTTPHLALYIHTLLGASLLADQ